LKSALPYANCILIRKLLAEEAPERTLLAESLLLSSYGKLKFSFFVYHKKMKTGSLTDQLAIFKCSNVFNNKPISAPRNMTAKLSGRKWKFVVMITCITIIASAYLKIKQKSIKNRC
jgi:hypothetical protein